MKDKNEIKNNDTNGGNEKYIIKEKEEKIRDNNLQKFQI